MVRPIGNLMRWWGLRHADTPMARRKLASDAAAPPWLRELARLGAPGKVLYPTTTLSHLLDQTAGRYGGATAIMYHGQSRTYRELLQDVNRAAAGLAGLGVRHGDRVLLTLPNCPEYIMTFFAIQKLGAIVVNAGPLIGLDDLANIAARTRPKLAIGLDLQAALLEQVARSSAIQSVLHASLESYQPLLMQMGYRFRRWQHSSGDGGEPRHVTMAYMMEHASSRPPTVAPQPDDLAVLQPTGGTTALPKLAQLSHRNVISNAAQISSMLETRQSPERFLGILPMFHVYGLTTCLITPVMQAGTIIPVTRFKPGDLLEIIERDRPTIMSLVPLIIERLCEELERRRSRRYFDDVRACISGAAPLPPQLAKRFERLTGLSICQGYGLTEASPVTHATPIGFAKPGSIGLPLPDTNVRIADLADVSRDAAPDEPGELLINGPQVMSGYYEDPQQTAEALFTDSAGLTWLRTGDVVTVDADGYFHVVDRKRDTINHGGFKIYPAKIERLLEQHDRVDQVAVIGREDAGQTEIVVAIVKPIDEVKDPRPLVDALKTYCREHLAPYEVPAVIEFVDELPYTPLGKLQRAHLRDKPRDQGEADLPPTPAQASPADLNGKANAAANGQHETEKPGDEPGAQDAPANQETRP